MKIIELNILQRDAIIQLFYDVGDTQANYQRFVDTYLSDLNSYRSFDIEQADGSISSLISFYMSRDEACWYVTDMKTTDTKNDLRILIESVTAFNEGTGRLKFYKLCNRMDLDQIDIFMNTRYDYIDECVVPAKTRCIYNNYWQILYNRILPSSDTVVRCLLLKQKYRKILPISGNI
jgi:hypothetical protein